MKIKTLLSLFLFFLFSVASAWAEDSYPEYITDIKLIGGTQDKVDNLKPAYKKLGWTIIDVNLNEGVTGSDFVFLIYKKGSRASTDGGYVTDLYLNAQSGDHPDGSQTETITYDGRTYYRAPYDGNSDFYTYRGHLNAKAGGMNIHLYYTKANFSDKRALSSITCNYSSSNGQNDKVLYWWNNLNDHPANVNIGNNGSAIYIHVTTATKKNRPSSDPVMATGLVYNGQPQKLIKTAATISSGTMYYKVGSEEYTSTASEVMATEASDHTVSYYAGANDYGDASDVLSQTVTIAKSPNSSASISITSSLYWDETLPPPVINNLSTGTITYKYSTSQNGTYSTTKPVSSGTYWVKAEIAGDDNCNSYTTAATSFRFVGWTGSGTSAKPYIISSTEELDLLASRVNNGNNYNGAYFELGANVTYVPVDSDNNGEYESNFTPIGDEDHSFAGIFDGKGHTVSGIVVKSGGNFAGLFGKASGSASIKNLTIANSLIEGINFVGGIVGYIYSWNVVIENCHVSAEVSVKGSNYVGGIVGINYGNIRGNSSDAAVSGSRTVGGIVGENVGSVENSLYFGSSVTASINYYVGAISGELKSSGSLDNNYHTLSGMGGVGNTNSATGEDKGGAKLAAPFTDEPADIGVAGTPYGTGNYVGITPYTNGLKYKDKFYRIPWTGSGTESDPYIISSTEGLDLLAQKVNSGNQYKNTYFELGADITYDSKPLTIDLDGDGPNLSNYTPIGNSSAVFWGKFDGKGHKVSGIVVKSSDNYVGLFGYVEGSASIKHLTLVNSSIEGYDGVGGIVGSTSLHVLVENCHVSDVRVKGRDRVGGITGTNWGKIKGCTSAAEVSGSQAVGGIVGQSIQDYGSVENSLYYGISVTATNYVGAISGGGGGSFTNNYHTLSGMGGVGNSESATGGDIDGARKAVALSAVDGVTLTLAGNPVNYDVSGITVYEKDDKFSSGILYDSKLYAGATEDVMLNLGYTVSDYEVLMGYTDGNGNALAANDDGTYTLTMKSAAATVTPAIKYLWGEGTKGTAENPYIISSTEGLDLLAQKVNSGNQYKNTYFELGADITYEPKNLTVDLDNNSKNESNFTPIGYNNNWFIGSFDGKGHTVSGIVVESNSDYVGLFGYVGSSVSIKNLTLANSSIKGNENVGGIVGYVAYSSDTDPFVENCHVSANVLVKGGTYVGGIAGYNSEKIIGCTSDANVSGNGYVGGIVGENGGLVKNSLYLGKSVTATENSRVGAIAGYVSYGGSFTNNYHTLEGKGGEGNYTNTGSDTEGAEFAEVFSVEPVGIGSAGTSYGMDNYVGITPYANGLEYKGKFYRPFWTGHGTETDPYIIISTAGLDLLAQKVNNGEDYENTYFELGADITYVPVDSDNNNEYDNNFTPIGFEDLFYGKFDGKGHTVSGIVVNAYKMGVGLFGHVAGSASIKNLTLANSSFVSNQNNMGGIVGAVWGADVVIENCHVSAGVSVTGATFLGGIVGYNIGTINGCTSEAKVSGTQAVGGIVGNNLGVIENNLYLGNSVTATDKNKVGAIAGYVDRGHPDCKASFTNNYHTLDGMGGVGNTESATGEDTDDAMLAKVVTEKPTDIGKSGTPYGSDDYVGITPYDNGLEYKDYFYYKPLWTGSGTEADPYIITSTEGLDLLAQKVYSDIHYTDTYFELGADISYDPKKLTVDLDNNGENESNYMPIGGYKSVHLDRYFSGNFDGKGHTISGIVVKSDNYVGLFGSAIGSSIKNLTLTNSFIEGDYYVGGILGATYYMDNMYGIVENCHVFDVSVKGNYYVGGIVGLEEGTIKGSTSDAVVSGSVYVGGIVGRNNGFVENSLYFGKSVTATDGSYVGTIAGYIAKNASLKNNYHTLKGVGGVGELGSATGYDIDNAKFAAPFSVVPAGIGTAETSYGTGDYVGITPYTNGLAYKGRYYYAGTLVEGYAAVQIFKDAEGKKHAIIDGEYDGPDAVKIEEDIDVTSVTFSREFTPNSGFATIMLPFNVNASSLTGVRSIIEFAGVFDNNGKNAVGMKYVWCNADLGAQEFSNGRSNCNMLSGSLEAYTPYMVEMESATLGIEGKITLKPNSGKTVGDASKDNWVFRGALQYKEWSGDEKIIENGRLWAFAAAARSGATIGKFVKFGGSNWVNPFRAYLVDCSDVPNNMDCEDYFETPSSVSRYHFADVLSTVGNSAENSLSAKTPTANAAGETASLNGMEIVIVDSGKDSVSGKEHTTVIGHVNPSTGEIRMLPRTKQTYDLKGRKVGNGKKAKGAYYRK